MWKLTAALQERLTLKSHSLNNCSTQILIRMTLFLTSTHYLNVAKRELSAPLNQLKFKWQLSELSISSFSLNTHHGLLRIWWCWPNNQVWFKALPKTLLKREGRLTNSTSAPPKTSKAPICKRRKTAELCFYTYTDKLSCMTQIQSGTDKSAQVWKGPGEQL